MMTAGNVSNANLHSSENYVLVWLVGFFFVCVCPLFSVVHHAVNDVSQHICVIAYSCFVLRGQGHAVSVADVALLTVKPLRSYYDREICAVRRSQSQSGTTTARKSTAGGKSADEEELIYAEVLERCTVAGNRQLTSGGIATYRVRVGPTQVHELLSTDMYSFRDTVAPISPVHMAAAADPTPTHPDTPPAAGIEGDVIDVAHGASGGVAANKSEVSTVEYVNAVESLLRRSNLSLSTERQTMISRALALEVEHAALVGQLKEASEQLDHQKGIIHNVEQEQTCTICFQTKEDGVNVNVALVPCGHCYCEDCVERIKEDSSCPQCKQSVSGSLKVFR